MASKTDLQAGIPGIVDVPCSTCQSPLHYHTPEDRNRVKGKVMLYCPVCSIKHFGDAAELTAWVAAQKVAHKAAKRKENRDE